MIFIASTTNYTTNTMAKSREQTPENSARPQSLKKRKASPSSENGTINGIGAVSETGSDIGLRRRDRGTKDSKKNKNKKKRRRGSTVARAARDPRDQASPIDEAGTRSPSPVIDFDGLSRPSE